MSVDISQGNVPLLEFGSLGDKPTIVDSTSRSNILSIPDSDVKSRRGKKKRKKRKKSTKEEVLSQSSMGTSTTYDATMLPIMNSLINWTPTSTSQVK